MDPDRMTLPARFLDSEGRQCIPVSTGVILRSDRMIGWYDPTLGTVTEADVKGWYTAAELAKLASPYLPSGELDPLRAVSTSDIAERLRARWPWSDLRKPKGWERVVDARRNGIEHSGRRLPLTQWCTELGISRTGLLTRLARPDLPMDRVMQRGGPPRNSKADLTVPSMPIMSAKGYVVGQFEYGGYIGTLRDHCVREGRCFYTVRDRLRKGVPWPKAIEMRRKTRSDIGLPNPKRSIYAWDPGFVSRRDAAKQARQAMLEPVEVLTDEQRARARHNDRLRASLPPPPPNLLDAFDVGVPVPPSTAPAHDSSPAASAPPTHQNAA
jgi:hypothetical protein